MHNENIERLKLLAANDNKAAIELMRMAIHNGDFELSLKCAVWITSEDRYHDKIDVSIELARELFNIAINRNVVVARWAASFLKEDRISQNRCIEFKENDLAREEIHQKTHRQTHQQKTHQQTYPPEVLDRYSRWADFDFSQMENDLVGELLRKHILQADFSQTKNDLARETHPPEVLGRDLRWADFSGMDLSEKNLKMVNLSYANLEGTSFGYRESRSIFPLPSSSLDALAADLTRANLSGANLKYADLNRVNLTGANLAGAILTKTKLHGTNFQRANLSGVDLSSAEISAACFVHANLSGANLSGCNFSGSNFSYANLSKANLSDVRLDLVDLDGSNFEGVTLCDVNLSGANLYLRNLKGRDLSSANLTGANLSRVKYDNFTKWPEGFIIPDDAIFDDTDNF